MNEKGKKKEKENGKGEGKGKGKRKEKEKGRGRLKEDSLRKVRRADAGTDVRTNTQVILYSVQCQTTSV